MDAKHLACFLVIGVLARWLAGMIMKGRGFGFLGDMIVGILGAVIGGWLFYAIGLMAYGSPGVLVMSFVGAVVLLSLISVVKRV